MFDGVVDFLAAELQRHRCQATQFGLGVLINDLGQRQDEEPRRVFAHQAIPARQLNVTDEGAVRQDQVPVQIQPTIRATWAARCANHQAQHAMAPTAH